MAASSSSFSGVLPGAVSAARPTVQVENDLRSAIQLTVGEWQKVIYPKGSREIPEDALGLAVEICLVEDPTVHGTADEVWRSSPRLNEDSGVTLKARKDFGSFGARAKEFWEQLQKEVEDEQKKREAREAKLQEAERQHTLRSWFPYHACAMVLVALGLGACVWMSVSEDRNHFTVALVSVASIFFLVMLMAFGSVVRNGGSLFQRQSLKLLAYHSPTVFLALGAICVCFVLTIFVIGGFWWSLVIALPLFCCLAWMRWHCSRSLEDELREAEAITLEVAIERARTLVFHGQVLEGQHRPCICSWPGKYESAWNEMVECSNEGTVSAAVVFLPEGSKHHGFHDKIPERERNEGIQGECWCVPLYGEEKEWGCRWWTKWIANVELAVEKGAKLQVYFFKGMAGKGKVRDFSTAGQEHSRRDQILERKKGEEFKALKGCIQNLSEKKRADGSSQHSREVNRLFLEWLGQEDREFMQAAEGLGNSQKAEVAWLDRKGYKYEEVDISEWEQHSNWNEYVQLDMPQPVLDMPQPVREDLEITSNCTPD